MNLRKYIFNYLFSLSIFLILIANNIYAQSGNTSEFTLDNGLKIVVREDHRAPVVVSQIWYKVGSSYEPDGITGISHMLEHMMFKASKNLSDGAFTKIIAINGGDENAFTNYDYTGYYQVLAASRLPISFKLEAERMQNLVLDEKAFHKEREVVMEERRLRTDDDPFAKVLERTMAAAYISSPYHNPVIGWSNDIKNYTLNNLKNWYRKWYAPNNATLVVVGDVDPYQVVALAKNYFANIPSHKIPQVKPRREVKPLGERRLNLELKAKVNYLLIAYNTPSLKSAKTPKDVYAIDVLSAILGGQGSRLKEILMHKLQLVTDISSEYDPAQLHESLLFISAIPAAQASLDEIERVIYQQIEKLKNELISDQELEKVRNQVIAQKIYDKDSVLNQAQAIGIYESIGLSWRDEDNYLENIKQVSSVDVQTAARKYLTKTRRTVATLVPQN